MIRFLDFIDGQWRLEHRNHLVKLTFMEAWKSRSPSPGLVYHSDRGPNFRSFGLGKLLMELGVVESFSRPHTPYDNSVNEAFFKNLNLALLLLV